jgi:hypothetical protein
MSLFQSKYALVSQYADLGFAAIEAGSSIAPVFLCKTNRNSRIAYFMNGTDSEMTILVVAPDGDATDPAQVHLFLRVEATTAINFNNIGQDVEPGTTFLVYRSGSAAATESRLQFLIWG